MQYLISLELLVQMTGPNKPLFSGVAEDVKGRTACYKQDWDDGFRSGLRFVWPYDVNACASHHKLAHLFTVLHEICCQDIGTNTLHILCICCSCNSLWGANEQRYRWVCPLFSLQSQACMSIVISNKEY